MEESTKKTDERIKEGKNPATANDPGHQHTPISESEADEDDAVHEQQNDISDTLSEQDEDEAVHESQLPDANTDIDLEDPDDLVHDTTIHE